MGIFTNDDTSFKIESILSGYEKPTATKIIQLEIAGNLKFDINHPNGRPLPAVALKDLGLKVTQQKLPGVKDQAAAAGIRALSSTLADKMTDGMFGDSYIGQNLANIFSQGVSSAGNTMATNLVKGQALTQGLGQSVGQSVQGAALGLGANLVGLGINSIGGDTRLSRGIGQGVATGLVNMKGITNSFKAIKTAAKAGKAATDAQKAASLAGKTNLVGIGSQVLGSALGAATGPSKEYGGKYGGITQKADMAYDLTQAAVGFIPGVGTGISGIMALNKGLSNIFGSTDGMTVQDAILGSAFMPAPVKWLNMAGATTTGTFNNQSWLNQQKADSFMGNAFGNLGDKFAKARDEAGKTYGTFSRGAAKEALDNINFANSAWNKILAMADLNELQNIRSLYMTSINNQRYAQLIGGAYQPISRGKYGMKILNNATNHNIGMRLLSGAALIDNKAMILSAQGGTKVTRPPRMRAHRKGDESRGLTPEEQEWWRQHEEEQKRQLEEETARKIKEKEEAANKFNKQTSTVMGAMTLQANETPFTGLEYQQAAEDLRQKKVEKFHEAEKIGEATLMADLAVSAAPLLLRGFRWAFNKAGLLIKVPVGKYKIGKEFSNSDIILPKEYNIENSPKTINYYPDKKILNNVSTIKWNDATKPSVNWNADNWFKTISGRTSYSSEEAAELVSHIPEYREIEKRLFNEGKLIIDSNGNIIVKGSNMSPQEYIMRQSEAFQKMNPEHHYVGVKKELRNSFENESRDPQTENRYEVWTDRKDPKNVEEYAYSGFDGDTVDSRIEKLKKLLDDYQNGYYNSYWKRDLKEAKEMYESGQINKQYYDDWVNKINNSYNEEISRIKRDLEATIRQKEIDPLDGGKVFDVTYPKDINETPIINAEGRNWAEIPYEYVERDAPDLISHYKGKPHPDEVQTDVIINMAKRHGYPVTHINNVMDTGNGTLLNETIIGKNIPVKSVLGNTGSFDIDSPNKWKLYRSWLPWFLGGSTAATLYNTNK